MAWHREGGVTHNGSSRLQIQGGRQTDKALECAVEVWNVVEAALITDAGD